MFTLSDNVANIVWWTLPIAEILTSIISFFILKHSYKQKIEAINVKVENSKISRKIIISIAREHGTGGKEIARKVAKELGLAFYDKEEIKNFAVNKGLIDKNIKERELYNFYLSLDAEKDAIIKQSETIRKIALQENCVIVGRSADYILKDSPHITKIFLYAPLEYRINKIKEMYNDTYDEAKKHVLNSDKSRASYYEVITNQKWGHKENYDLILNCKIGTQKAVDIICDYIEKTVND